MNAYQCAMLSALLFLGRSLGAEPAVGELERIRYTQLTEIINQNKGKVVLIDFWGDFCLPCKREFPNFVKLHQKLGKAGLVAILVSLDDPDDKETKIRVENFLKLQKATTRNLLLNEKIEFWQKKLKIDGPPCVFLFDQQGRLVSRWSDAEVDYKRIEKRVDELLRENSP